MILIKNGYVIDPKSRTEEVRDILIDKEKQRIVQIGKNLMDTLEKKPEKIIHADGDRKSVV